MTARGKPILQNFYKRHGFAQTGLGWNAFVTELARIAGLAPRAQDLVHPTILRIRLYFPNEISTVLMKCAPGRERDQLLPQANEARSAWESGRPESAGREQLRERLLHFARDLRASGDPAGDTLLRLSVSIGTAS